MFDIHVYTHQLRNTHLLCLFIPTFYYVLIYVPCFINYMHLLYIIRYVFYNTYYICTIYYIQCNILLYYVLYTIYYVLYTI